MDPSKEPPTPPPNEQHDEDSGEDLSAGSSLPCASSNQDTGIATEDDENASENPVDEEKEPQPPPPPSPQPVLYTVKFTDSAAGGGEMPSFIDMVEERYLHPADFPASGSKKTVNPLTLPSAPRVPEGEILPFLQFRGILAEDDEDEGNNYIAPDVLEVASGSSQDDHHSDEDNERFEDDEHQHQDEENGGNDHHEDNDENGGNDHHEDNDENGGNDHHEDNDENGDFGYQDFDDEDFDDEDFGYEDFGNEDFDDGDEGFADDHQDGDGRQGDEQNHENQNPQDDMMNRGDGDLMNRGDGDLMNRGDGDLMNRGDGDLMNRGDGDLMNRGDGDLMNRGDGDLMNRGDGDLMNRGDGDLMNRGDGAHMAQQAQPELHLFRSGGDRNLVRPLNFNDAIDEDALQFDFGSNRGVSPPPSFMDYMFTDDEDDPFAGQPPMMASSLQTWSEHLKQLSKAAPRLFPGSNNEQVRRTRSISVSLPLSRSQELLSVEVGQTLRRLSDEFSDRIRRRCHLLTDDEYSRRFESSPRLEPGSSEAIQEPIADQEPGCSSSCFFQPRAVSKSMKRKRHGKEHVSSPGSKSTDEDVPPAPNFESESSEDD